MIPCLKTQLVDRDSFNKAKQAIENLNGFNFQGKDLVVNETKPKEYAPLSGSGGYGGSSGRSGSRGFEDRYYK